MAILKLPALNGPLHSAIVRCARHMRLIAFMALAALSAIAHAAPSGEHGGEGILIGSGCFQTDNSFVKSVCADYKISWKLWILAGEPIGDYKLKWTLTNVTLNGGKTPETQITFGYWEIPEAIAAEVRKLELMFDGRASVSLNGRIQTYHDFNTGVATPAGKTSYNTPGGSDWKDIFVGPYGQPVPAEEAKRIFRRSDTGIAPLKLGDNPADLKSGVYGMGPLMEKVNRLCRSRENAPKFRFCPPLKEKPKTEEKPVDGKPAAQRDSTSKKPLGISALDGDSSHSTQDKADTVTADTPATPMIDMLDADTAQSVVDKRLKEELSRFRQRATPTCEATLRNIGACYDKTPCRKPGNEPSVETCRQIPEYPDFPCNRTICLTAVHVPQPGEPCYHGEDAECRAFHARQEREKEQRERDMQRQQEAWRAQYGSISRQCRARSEERTAYAACLKPYATSCNPKGFKEVSNCVDEEVRLHGPTEKDARVLVEREWKQRGQTGAVITNSILD